MQVFDRSGHVSVLASKVLFQLTPGTSTDTAFHAIPLAMIDPEFAKKQLDLLTREWYMHPNGQLPAYEWEFGDVNPPVVRQPLK